jgi:hypothetical protein
MNYLRRHLVLVMVSVAMLLGVFVTSSNAQYRRSGWSFNISYGQPYYQPYSRYVYRRPRYYNRSRPRSYAYVREYRRPVYYRSYNSYPVYPVRYRTYNNGYNNRYYGNSRKKHKKHRKHYRNSRYVYRDVRYR